MEEAKKVHTSLRKAGGLIKFVQDTLLPQLVEKISLGSDLDIRVISAYLNQCTAEAQEVTIARAIELKHNASLIASLAYETSKMFTTASDSLSALDPVVFGKWRSYFLLKSKFYMAYVSISKSFSIAPISRVFSHRHLIMRAKVFLPRTNVAKPSGL